MAQTFSRTACVAVRAQDDLRTELSLAYKHPEVSTPHLDALANKSMVFQNAYCQQPICSPSRNSFMSGLTPDHTKAWNFIQYFREARPDAVSLPGAQLLLYTVMLYQRRSLCTLLTQTVGRHTRSPRAVSVEYFKNAGYLALGGAPVC